MSDIVQLYSDKLKTTKAYPKTLASETYMSNGGTVESQLDAIDSKNVEQDVRLKDIEYKNKVQDVKLQGLFNENNDGRLSIEGEGNSLKLEGSKKGLVTVDKVVGNTMVNLATIRKGSFNFHPNPSVGVNIPLLRKINTVFTVIINVKNHTLNYNCKIQLNCDDNVNIYPTGISSSTTGLTVFKIQPIKEGKFHNVHTIRFYTDNTTEGNFAFDDLIILEGDYTDKPIPSEYSEGMQSSFEECKITQQMVDEGLEDAENLGKYKYEVEVRGKNLFKIGEEPWKNSGDTSLISWDSNSVVATANTTNNWQYIKIPLNGLEPNTDYTFTYNVSANRYARVYKGTMTIDNQDGANTIRKFNTGDNNDLSIRLFITTDNGETGQVAFSNMQIEEGLATSYEDYYCKTKTVYLKTPLHKNDELIIEDGELKHWHKMGEDVLNGSESSWGYNVLSNGNKYFTTNLNNAKPSNYNTLYSDKYASVQMIQSYNGSNGIYVDSNSKIRVLDSSFQNLTSTEFKQALSQKPVTVIYELAEPYKEVIDTNGFLMEIPDNATISIKSVVPVQSVKATYTANIPSVYGLQETNNNQDNLIDISLCATDEMYMMIEPILEAMPKTININKRMVSKMVDMYVAMVIRGLKTIEEVPVRYRKEVQDILNKLEK